MNLSLGSNADTGDTYKDFAWSAKPVTSEKAGNKKAPTDLTQLAPRFLEPEREGWSRLGSARKTQLNYYVVQALTEQGKGAFKTEFNLKPALARI